jgi:CheY-like chemotaxis protein
MASTERPRLLVVDDDAEITNSFEAIFRGEGYSVVTANDGAEALDLVRRGPPFAVVLLDLLLPDLDGWTVLRHIRQLAPTTRVVILCADVDEEGEVEAFRLGAVDVLLKPPDVYKLLRFVEELTRGPQD